jgi:hypothetical protein
MQCLGQIGSRAALADQPCRAIALCPRSSAVSWAITALVQSSNFFSDRPECPSSPSSSCRQLIARKKKEMLLLVEAMTFHHTDTYSYLLSSALALIHNKLNHFFFLLTFVLVKASSFFERDTFYPRPSPFFIQLQINFAFFYPLANKRIS